MQKIKKRDPSPKIPIKILFPESESEKLYTLAALHKMTVNKYIVCVVLGYLNDNLDLFVVYDETHKDKNQK